MQRLTDQVAVVTGAAQGIGRGIASVLGAEGARVVLCDLDAELAESTATSLREDGIDVAHNHACAFRPEDGGESAPDALRGTGDDRDLIGKTLHDGVQKDARI